MDPRIRIHTKMSWIQNNCLPRITLSESADPEILSGGKTGARRLHLSRDGRRQEQIFPPVFRIRIYIRIRIHMLLSLLDPDPLVRTQAWIRGSGFTP